MKYRGTIKDWEVVTQGTARLRVHGGWLVENYGEDDRSSSVFVPDPHHEWVVEKMER